MAAIRTCERCGQVGEGRYCGRCGGLHAGARPWRRGMHTVMAVVACIAGIGSAVFVSNLVRDQSGRPLTDFSSVADAEAAGYLNLSDGLPYTLPNGATVTLRLHRGSRRFMLEHDGRREWLRSEHEIRGAWGGERLRLILNTEDVQRANAWFTIEPVHEDGRER